MGIRWAALLPFALSALVIPALLMPVAPDASIDWVLLRAGWQGLDITRTPLDLAGELGVQGAFSNVPVARPPAFFIAYLPFLPDPTLALWAMVCLNALGIGIVVHVAQRMWQLNILQTIIVGSGCLVLAFESIAWTNPSVLLSALIALTWRRIDSHWGWGIPLGVAAAIRLWPLLVIAWLITRRRRSGWGALATASVLTLLGLTVVSPADAVANLTAGAGWAGSDLTNLSLSWAVRDLMPIWITVLVGGSTVIWAACRMDVRFGYGLVAASAVILSPIAWPAYLLATAPAWPLLLGSRLAGLPLRAGKLGASLAIQQPQDLLTNLELVVDDLAIGLGTAELAAEDRFRIGRTGG